MSDAGDFLQEQLQNEPLYQQPAQQPAQQQPAYNSDNYRVVSTGVSRVTIPTLPKLKGDSNIATWKEAVRVYAELLGLSNFLDGTALPPPPTAPKQVRDSYSINKTTAYLMIRNSVEPVMDLIRSRGWTDAQSDPHALFKLTCDAVSDVADAGWYNLFSEFAKMDASKYDSLRAFLARYLFLVARLEDRNIIFCDRARQAFLLDAMSKYDKRWTDMLEFQLQTGKLQHRTLLNLVTVRADEQAMSNMLSHRRQ